MAEYIEREALKACLWDEAEILRDAEEWEAVIATRGAIAIVNEQPAADVVEVVRCKDCRRSLESEGYLVCDHALPTKSIDQYFTVGTDILAIVKPYDFCSYGERRDKDD